MLTHHQLLGLARQSQSSSAAAADFMIVYPPNEQVMQNHEAAMAEYFDNDLVQGVVETIRSSTPGHQESSICHQQDSEDQQPLDSPFMLETPVGIQVIEEDKDHEKQFGQNENCHPPAAFTMNEESKKASIGKFISLKHHSNLTSDGEELVAFSARLINEEGDSSGFIY